MLATDRRLTVLAPGLLGPWGMSGEFCTEDLEVPALEMVLSRSRCFAEAWPDNTLEGMLFHLFGAGKSTSDDWPAAAVTRGLDDGLTNDNWNLRADPVHLDADLNNLVLVDASAFSISPGEAKALVREINNFYAGDGWSIKAPHAERWYVQVPLKQKLRTCSLYEATGRDISASLPEGPDAALWRRRFNEIQMILHGSAVNQSREAKGELTVNSVWFWGGGSLPTKLQCRWQRVWAKDPLAQGLARLAGCMFTEPTDTADGWLNELQADGEHLVMLGEGRGLVRDADVEAWRDYIVGLEKNWFRPLATALRRRAIAQLTLFTGSGRGFRVTPSLWRHWWRRRRALQSFLD